MLMLEVIMDAVTRKWFLGWVMTLLVHKNYLGPDHDADAVRELLLELPFQERDTLMVDVYIRMVRCGYPRPWTELGAIFNIPF